MNPAEFSEVAGLLSSMTVPPQDGRLRSAVSRYYYAAFLEARDQLKTKRTIEFKKHELHENVKRAFAWSDDKALKLVGRLLEDLKKLREKADYDITGTMDVTATNEAKRICTDIQQTLNLADVRLCKDPLGRS